MARWQDVVDTAPEFAKAAQAIFDAGKHKTMASLRKDGAPRISGIEATFSDGDVWLGMMPASLCRSATSPASTPWAAMAAAKASCFASRSMRSCSHALATPRIIS